MALPLRSTVSPISTSKLLCSACSAARRIPILPSYKIWDTCPACRTVTQVSLVDTDTYMKNLLVSVGLKPDLSSDYLQRVKRDADAQGLSNVNQVMTELISLITQKLLVRSQKR